MKALITFILLALIALAQLTHQLDQTMTNDQVAILKEMTYRRKDYVDVRGLYVKQKADMDATGVKKRLFDTKNCVELAGPYLSANTTVSSKLFDTLLNVKQSQLQNFMSLQLEVDNLLAIIQNSATSLNADITYFVRNFSKKAYGSEEFTLTNQTLTFQTLTIRKTEGILPSYYNAKTTRRIRNRISVGEYHVLFLLPNGKLYSSGYSVNNNLGRGTDAIGLNTNMPVDGLDGRQILQFEANGRSNLVLTDNGVYAWGFNDYGQLGTGDLVARASAVKVMGFAGNNISQIALSEKSAFAIDTNGKVWAWGSNSYGQLGDRTGAPKARPFPVYYNGTMWGKKAVRVCSTYYSSVILTSDSTLFTFGDNTYSSLGVTTTSKTIEPIVIPATGVLAGKNISDIQCGYYHVLVLLTDGSVVTWGYNDYYQLGDGTTTATKTPKLVTFPGGTCKGSQIITKYYTNFVICRNNDVYTWGRSDYGQTGIYSGYTSPNGYSHVYTPILLRSYFGNTYPDHKVVEMASGKFNSFMLSADGKYWGVGTNDVSSNVFFKQNTLMINYFIQLTHYFFMALPWTLRKTPYFEVGENSYMLISDSVVPTRSYNGFNMYTKNRNETENSWRLIEYDSSTKRGFPVSIYSSHYLKNDEYVYFFGGFQDDMVSSTIWRAPLGDVEGGWEKMTYTLPYPIAAGSTWIIADYYYIFGGIKQLYTTNADGSLTQNIVVSDAILRAPLSDLTNWVVLNNRRLPATLHSSHIDVVWPYVYLFGGCQSGLYPAMNIFRALLTDPGTWEMTFGLLPHYTANGVLVSTPNHLFLIGGGPDNPKVGSVFMARAWKTDPTGSWMATAENIPEFFAPVGRINGTEVVMIGQDTRPYTSATTNLDVASTLTNFALAVKLFEN